LRSFVLLLSSVVQFPLFLAMINGAHLLLYSTDADADRTFLRDVLQFPSLDVGRGWLIFALPPSEVAVHPTEDAEEQKRADGEMPGAELYLMCHDVRATMKALEPSGLHREPHPGRRADARGLAVPRDRDPPRNLGVSPRHR
jgi:hypothetical protein